MVRGRNKKIVYSYEDLAKVWPKSGTRGAFIFQARFHEGHRKCAEAVQHCDCVLGIIDNNMTASELWMSGREYSRHYEIIDSDIEALNQYCDYAVIRQGGYFPEREHWQKIKAEFSEAFPIECLLEKEILSDYETYIRLRYSVAFRYVLHGVYGINYDEQVQCGKDRFRSVGYSDYVFDRWGVRITLIDPVQDEFGNAISRTINGLPMNLRIRIDRKLVLPEFGCIEDVQDHVKSIEDLKVINFYLNDAWVHATFAFDGYKPWTEGVRRCKS